MSFCQVLHWQPVHTFQRERWFNQYPYTCAVHAIENRSRCEIQNKRKASIYNTELSASSILFLVCVIDNENRSVWDIQGERIQKWIFQSIHYQLWEMCAVSIVSVMCHPTPVKQLVALAGVDRRCQKTDWHRVWYLAPRNFQIPNSSASVYMYLQIHSSQIQIQIHIQDPIQPEASKRRRVIRLIRHQKEILAASLRFPFSWQFHIGWKLVRRHFTCQMELWAKPQVAYASHTLRG